MKKIMTVVGARPQFIKAAPVSRALRNSGGLVEILVHTGQHYDQNISNVFFDELELPKPDHYLGVGSGSHGQMTGAMLEKLNLLLQRNRPDCVLVYGDTNSTLAGALAASQLNIPIAHVEAGLRSYNRRMPEEKNRLVADHLADLLFTPTDTATNNLLREGIEPTRIHQIGDVMFDAAIMFGEKSLRASTALERLRIEPKRYVLATIHRAETTDDPHRLRTVVEALEVVARLLPVILPLHPRTRAALASNGLAFRHVTTTDPVGYIDMVALESGAAVIATDSGGIQKEAYFHKIPCVTLRDETEWVELIDLGWNHLVSPHNHPESIAGTILAAQGKHGSHVPVYGTGQSAGQLIEILQRVLFGNGRFR
jgi:UDP-GlcNAc3NAcA epimerase